MSGPGPEREPPLDLRLVPVALAAWVVAWRLQGSPPGPVLAAALALAVLGAALLRRRRALAGAVLLAVAAAATCTATRTAVRTAPPLPELVGARAAVTAEVVLTDDARRVATAGGRELAVVPVRLVELEARGLRMRLRAPAVVLAEDPAWLALLPGQRAAVEARLGPPRPGDPAAAALTGAGAPRRLGRPPGYQRVAGTLRAGLRDAVAPMPPAERGLLPGLVVGDTSRLDPQLREDFRATGLSHLVAVSGANVAILLGALLLLCRWTGVPLRARPLLGAVALVGFVVLARPSPSVLRAAAMGAVGLLALATGGRRRTLPALAAAVLVLVLVSPDLAAEPGFALSVLATGGLVLLAPHWTEVLARRMPRWLAGALAVPAAAQVACGPVVAAIGGGVGLLSVPANLLAVPAVAPATVLGVLAALVAPLSLPLAQLLAWAAWPAAAWLVLVARTGAAVPSGTVAWPAGLRGALLLLAVTGGLLLVLARPRLRRVAASVAAGSLVAGVALAALRPAWPPPGWVLVACDVGQGDALVLSAGARTALVVDAGPDPRAVDRCLDRLGVEQVPLVVLTHLHADHVDGLAGVLRGRRVGAVEVGPLAEPPQQWEQVRRDARGLPLQPARVGEVRRLGPLRWEVLAPRRAYRDSPNDSSLVLLAEVQGVRVLLTGDVEPEAQRDLRALGLRADVLKVPHHGSRHQDPELLAAVGARVLLTSVGAGNGYGHPAEEVLAALTASGALSLRTDLHGDLAVVVRDGRLSAVGSRASP